MTQQTPTVNPWSDDDNSVFLRLRMKTFWNFEYFERIILPLLNLPPNGRVLDVGCGNGGISLLLSDLRPDLQILGMDFEPKPLEDARAYASRNGLVNLTFEQGDAHNLKYDDATFDAVLCQTVLTHVRDAQAVVKEMTRVLKSGGVFFAAEYTNSAMANYDSVHFEKRDEEWYREYYRINRTFMKGKKALGRGDDTIGARVPLLATQSGLDVYDVRLNDRAMHVFPPYRHEKQRNYLELAKTANTIDNDEKWLKLDIETVVAGGGTEEDGRWFHHAIDSAGIVRAIEDGTFTATGSFALYLTFARKPD
ncbi:MAG: class I SAM-dependent methyltransferase [Anaerolineae bacterium]|nr:class I SAM-dependent methyltransferase [Anaerolineae bacterium]